MKKILIILSFLLTLIACESLPLKTNRKKYKGENQWGENRKERCT